MITNFHWSFENNEKNREINRLLKNTDQFHFTNFFTDIGPKTIGRHFLVTDFIS